MKELFLYSEGNGINSGLTDEKTRDSSFNPIDHIEIVIEPCKTVYIKFNMVNFTKRWKNGEWVNHAEEITFKYKITDLEAKFLVPDKEIRLMKRITKNGGI